MKINSCSLKTFLSSSKRTFPHTDNCIGVFTKYIIAATDAMLIRYSYAGASGKLGKVENPKVLYDRSDADILYKNEDVIENDKFPEMDSFFSLPALASTKINPLLLFQLCKIAGISEVTLGLTEGNPIVKSGEFLGLVAAVKP